MGITGSGFTISIEAARSSAARSSDARSSATGSGRNWCVRCQNAGSEQQASTISFLLIIIINGRSKLDMCNDRKYPRLVSNRVFSLFL